MKKGINLLLGVAIVINYTCYGKSEYKPVEDTFTLKVMSFNVRYENAGDTDDRSWENRRDAVQAMVADRKPDIMGVQEAVLAQKTYMDRNCTGYKSIGVGRDDGVNGGEFMVIYYLEESVKLENWGTFWLSETPSAPSKGWDASHYRTATYATFTHIESGKKFFVINTHLDNRGTTARTKSMELIEERMGTLNTDGYPMVLIGDFNSTINNLVFNGVKAFMGNARTDSPQTDCLNSFNGFGNGNESIIDHIFYTGFISLKFKTINRPYPNIAYISDHFPIEAELQFK